MKTINDIRFGVNYTPSRCWWHCWGDFHPDWIAQDLDTICQLEADHIRIFTLWPAFQPNAAWVSPAHIERLGILMDLADQRGLDVCVAALNGWLSGFRFVPTWAAKNYGYKQDPCFFTDPDVWQATEFYFRRLSEQLRDRPNFIGFDIGNELNVCWQSDSLQQADAWFYKLMDLMESLCPEQTHVNGVDHGPWLREDTFSPQALAKRQKIIALHTWGFFTGAFEHGGLLDAPSLNLPAAMAAMAKAWSGDMTKPVWIQEYGTWIEQCDYNQQQLTGTVIPKMLEEMTFRAWRAGANWFTWWCSHDLDRSLRFIPYEYPLGLITNDQKIKPSGFGFRDIARRLRSSGPCSETVTVHSPLPQRRSDQTSWQWLLDRIEAQEKGA
jgi:hypothetical protein